MNDKKFIKLTNSLDTIFVKVSDISLIESKVITTESIYSITVTTIQNKITGINYKDCKMFINDMDDIKKIIDAENNKKKGETHENI